jgi:hypothetical protein
MANPKWQEMEVVDSPEGIGDFGVEAPSVDQWVRMQFAPREKILVVPVVVELGSNPKDFDLESG